MCTGVKVSGLNGLKIGSTEIIEVPLFDVIGTHQHSWVSVVELHLSAVVQNNPEQSRVAAVHSHLFQREASHLQVDIHKPQQRLLIQINLFYTQCLM